MTDENEKVKLKRINWDKVPPKIFEMLEEYVEVPIYFPEGYDWSHREAFRTGYIAAKSHDKTPRFPPKNFRDDAVVSLPVTPTKEN